MWPSDPTLRTRIRGQSEVIGTLLLVSIVFITAGIVGVTLTANMVSQSTSDRIVIDCDIVVADGDVTLTHDGGVATDIGYLTVLLRNDSRTTRRPLVVDTGDGDDRFEIGEQTNLGTIGGMTAVLLLGAEEVVCEETLVPPSASTATPTPTQTPTATPTSPPTPTPTPTPDTPPIPSIDSVTDTSQCKEGNPNDNNPCSTRNEGEFAVAWSASDDNGLSSVTIDLSTSNGVVVASESVTVSGTSASGSVTLTDTGGYNQTYTITVTATDSSQQSAATTEEHTADGDGIGSPP